MKDKPEEIIIIKECRTIYGDIAILYIRKDQPGLKRIKIKGDDK